MLLDLFQKLTKPGNSFFTTISGTITGSIPTAVEAVTKMQRTQTEIAFQHTVWTITIILGITGIITFWQKQKDRYKKNKEAKK